MSVTVHVRLSDQLLADRGGVSARMLRTGINIQSRAKRLCPVDTGRLRSSIQTSAPLRRGRSVVVAIGSNVKYARYVEEGTRFMRARPYLQPALEQEMRT